MKRTLIAALALLLLAGCATTAQDEGPAAADIINADAGCAEVVANEYEQAQRPPSMEVRSTVREGDAVLVTGISRGKTTNPVPYEFQCRHMSGATVLESFDRAEGEETPAPTTSAERDLAFDEVAASMEDEQFDKLISGIDAITANLSCQAAAGRDYVPASEKPYTSDMEPATPYLGGFLVGGKIMGANGLVAILRCHVDPDGNAKVDGFDVVS